MPTIYSVMTPKGGVGKTTSLTGLACYIAGQLQKKVLLVDLDNIASLTNNFQGADVRYSQYSNVTDLFVDPDEQRKIVVSPISDRIHLIQGHSDMSAVNRSASLMVLNQLEENLKQNVPDFESYDYVLIDTPAGNGNIVLAALIASHRVYSPIDLDNNAITSLHELAKILKVIRNRMNPDLSWEGFLINRVPKLVSYLGKKVPEATTERVIYNELVEKYQERALLGVIAYRNPIKKAFSQGKWIEPDNDSARDALAEVEAFCKKLLESKQ
ncbi:MULTISPECIES: ParA family protein [Pseudomonas]|uniref:AAA family ATPase n=5 Tax=Pseudomonas aeruginosa TaxID=287 RepID=A0A5E5RC39_PSEAI|nr:MULTISPECIES: ParA family protein [Pseudomonas]AUA86832.1 ParA family protein [Pseudomonas aeruginosa]AUA92925.1 ParA family protein [Pseudomonas aeruginosa]EIU3538688.1 ParA family protein [Pseudomonas aeruginosa]EIY2515286.1 ParA family protein [Pseudomonas aeruginosa]EIY2823441.1 ParA family protein [Pseudomonas aeruginosa]